MITLSHAGTMKLISRLSSEHDITVQYWCHALTEKLKKQVASPVSHNSPTDEIAESETVNEDNVTLQYEDWHFEDELDNSFDRDDTDMYITQLQNCEHITSDVLAAFSASGSSCSHCLFSFFIARLIALSKCGGEVRPIAVGCVLRSLVAKIACFRVTKKMADVFFPLHLGSEKCKLDPLEDVQLGELRRCLASINPAINEKIAALKLLVNHLCHFNLHDSTSSAFSFSTPRHMFLLRSSPAFLSNPLQVYDSVPCLS
uniref:Uncharacterized protein n=1 Tax=Amphimedon queenslandica TaxID=400682 RepID=A0A1X7VPR5_AMPQE